jgi:hypothetical protein
MPINPFTCSRWYSNCLLISSLDTAPELQIPMPPGCPGLTARLPVSHRLSWDTCIDWPFYSLLVMFQLGPIIVDRSTVINLKRQKLHIRVLGGEM